MNNEWKEWNKENLSSENKSDIITVKFQDGLLGVPSSIINWINTVYNSSEITHYRIVEKSNE